MRSENAVFIQKALIATFSPSKCAVAGTETLVNLATLSTDRGWSSSEHLREEGILREQIVKLSLEPRSSSRLNENVFHRNQGQTRELWKAKIENLDEED